MLYKDSVGILKRANGTNTLLLQGRTADNTTNSLLIQDSANADLLEVLNDGEVRIDNKLTIGNYVNTNTLGVSGSVELIGSVDITGDTTITGDLDILGAIQIQDGTETDGYVLTAGTNGEAFWNALPETQTGTARKDVFTADGVSTNFNLTFAPQYVYYVSVNGIVQQDTVQYNITGTNLTFTDVLPDGYVIIASYAQVLVDVNLTGDATDILYVPGDAGDWSPQPTDVQEALDQLAATSSTMNIGATLFVSPTGSDVSAVKGDMNKPYQTITGAKDAAATGDLILVYPGTYDDSNLVNVSVNYLFLPGARVVNTSTASIFSLASPIVASVYGNGYFECTDASAFVATSITSTTFNFEFLKCKAVNQVINSGALWTITGNEVECTGTATAMTINGSIADVNTVVHNGASTGGCVSIGADSNVVIKEAIMNAPSGSAVGVGPTSNNAIVKIQNITSVWRGTSVFAGSNLNVEIGQINAVDLAYYSYSANLQNSTISIDYIRSTTNKAVDLNTIGNNVFNFGEVVSDTNVAFSIGGNSRDIINIGKAIGGADVAIQVASTTGAPVSPIDLVDLMLNVTETQGRIAIIAANSSYFHLSLVINNALIVADDYPVQINWQSSTQAQRFNLNGVRMRSANSTVSIYDAGGVSPEIAAFYCIADTAADASIINNGLPLVINSNV